MPIAKITRPRLSHVAPRSRLFRLLDSGWNRPVTWVASQGGAGKTTLIASWLDSRKLPCIWYQIDAGDGDPASFFYFMGMAAKKAAPRYRQPLPLLTPEYLQGIPVFTRRYFEQLFQRLNRSGRFVLVLDNYQEVPLESWFHDMLSQALETVPEDVRVIILSRSDPPVQIARLRANNRLQFIGWDDIRFTLREAAELLKTQGRKSINNKTLALLHSRTEGWAAGLVLLMAGASESHIDGDLSTRSLFDYFASQIFDRTEPSICDFLLRTSFLQRVDRADAERLTGNSSAGRILDQLHRGHYFTYRQMLSGDCYQYHPLFREFLHSRAVIEFSAEERMAIRQRAGAIMAETGRIDEAVPLLLESESWEMAGILLMGHAPAFAAQGRLLTLSGWLKRFPAPYIESSAWLLYWTGICCLAFAPGESRLWLEKAFDLFRKEGDRTGAYLSWASIVDTFIFEFSDFTRLERWLDVIDEMLPGQKGDSFPTPEIGARVASGMLVALTYCKPQRNDLPFWADRVRDIILTNSDVNLRMALGCHLFSYYVWISGFAGAHPVIDALRPAHGLDRFDPLTRQNWHITEAWYFWARADHEQCMRAVEQGIENADKSGVHLLDIFLLAQGVFSSLSHGDISAAETCLHRMAEINSPRLGDRGTLLYQSALVAWHRGDYAQALEQGRQAVEIAERIGWPAAHALCLLELSVTYFYHGDHDEADALLKQGMETGRGMALLEFLSFLYAAHFALHRRNEDTGIPLLKQAFGRGAQLGLMNFARWRSDIMSDLCAIALEHGIEPSFTHRLIRRRGLEPKQPVENWPYPLRIVTLGGFVISKDGKPVTYGSKSPKKPLELLKALISYGGENVSEERLIETLWPDSEGDLAHRSFETTLYRLRLLIGDKSLNLRNGLLSLDRGQCGVDAWEFEQLAGTAVARADLKQLERAAGMYMGHFLPGDNSASWSVLMRERLKGQYNSLIFSIGRHCEEHEEWNKAIDYYQKGLNADELAEEFYQGLMKCHIKLGQRARATFIYNRCREVLGDVLGLDPAPLTESIYASISKR